MKLRTFKEKIGKAGCSLLRRGLHKLNTVLAVMYDLQVPFVHS
ncbi:hypothetical protein NEOC65_001377 [Neochlamydia sp. AcF65]|nr:hypothetical protein [Neochlamydia sp. AcF65]MBS4171629.1 hypothetical protein [Neochlamydia sp. AcF95]